MQDLIKQEIEREIKRDFESSSKTENDEKFYQDTLREERDTLAAMGGCDADVAEACIDMAGRELRAVLHGLNEMYGVMLEERSDGLDGEYGAYYIKEVEGAMKHLFVVGSHMAEAKSLLNGSYLDELDATLDTWTKSE